MRYVPRAPQVYLLLLLSLLSLQAEQLHAAGHDDGAECQICLHAVQAQKSLHGGVSLPPAAPVSAETPRVIQAHAPYRLLQCCSYRSRAPPVHTSVL
mgnify:CR=1 FL=1